MTTPTGVIIVRQEGYLPIDEPTTLAAIPEVLRQCSRERVLLDLASASERALAAHDWHEAGRLLIEAYVERVKPLLTEHPDYNVAYFGTVPIPLAVQLGYLLGTWRAVDVFQQHHGRKDWHWPDAAGAEPKLEINVEGIPRDGSHAEGDLVVRVSTSYLIDRALTAEVVGRPLAEVDIKTTPIHEDAIESPRDLDAVADAFKRTLNTLHSLYPNATLIHLFASVPVGLALRLGMQVSPTIHPQVQTYEFDAKSNPKYYSSLLLQSEPAPRIVFDEDERAAAVKERNLWAEELHRLQAFATKLSEHQRDSWLGDVIDEQATVAFNKAWTTLPRLSSLVDLCNSRIDATRSEAPDGFLYEPNRRAWVLGDDFLIPIMRRIGDDKDRRRAARLFLLHEGLHAYQGLTAATSPQVGRFPKVLEEIDYQADVWAQLHERRLTAEMDPESAKDAPGCARTLMSVAVETMFSFDDGPRPSIQMQIRRVSRYLIWSWQHLRTERFAPDGNVWSVLAEKPVIELAGPEISARNNRLWYLLDARHSHSPELAISYENRLYRFAAGPASPHGQVLEALRARDAEQLRNALRGVFDLVVRQKT